ncbi:zinc-binding dehydrogenase [Nonomuraea sp. NPDC049784]|uniref:zinc-binding dehydrogenase n=1 Tax=Nonomuraea sp. NPDC049784 TaxID=3154361 RepID=UPI0033D68B3B
MEPPRARWAAARRRHQERGFLRPPGAPSGRLVVYGALDPRFDLADIAEAHRYMAANGQVGKIVVTVTPEATSS